MIILWLLAGWKLSWRVAISFVRSTDERISYDLPWATNHPLEFTDRCVILTRFGFLNISQCTLNLGFYRQRVGNGIYSKCKFSVNYCKSFIHFVTFLLLRLKSEKKSPPKIRNFSLQPVIFTKFSCSEIQFTARRQKFQGNKTN